MIICVTGTAGTGKTTLARILKKELNYEYVDVKKIIKEKNLYDSYDKKRKCYVVDTKRLNKFLIEKIKNNSNDLIFDSLLSHYLPKKYVDLCIVTKCGLKELKKRLEKRKYSKEKVRENLDAEIFDTSLNEAKEKGHYTFVINTTESIKKEVISKLIGEINAVKSTSRRIK
ncbi:MAG: AAA family ATPase [Nanoarchaeota archaeon]|nr:AAA family ATPase [Nanoarchaeota archaeon]